MCCGIPEDLYDLVIVVDKPEALADQPLADAFAAAFVAREQGQRVAVVLPATDVLRPRVRRLRAVLDLSEIVLIEGSVRPEAADDPHYLDVDGRLLYGERIIAPAAASLAVEGNASHRYDTRLPSERTER